MCLSVCFISSFHLGLVKLSPFLEATNPLQYSCLKNFMDGGAWWATIHGVTKSWTRLSDFTSLNKFTLKFLELFGGWDGPDFYSSSVCVFHITYGADICGRMVEISNDILT